MRRGSKFGVRYKVFQRTESIVEVHLDGGIIGQAYCNSDDVFNFRVGKSLALRRAFGQYFGDKIAKHERAIDVLWADRIEMESKL